MTRRKSTRLWIFAFLATFQSLFGVCVSQETCYPAGGVAGIVIATIVVTAVVLGLGAATAWKYRNAKNAPKQRDGEKHRQPSLKNAGDFAFDNPYFKDQEGDETDLEKGKTRSSLNKNSLRAFKSSDPNAKSKKGRSGKNNFIFGGGKKHRALDDSCLTVEPERTIVALRGHDFTGLGFNICGNMRDGILVKDVLHRGPASESGLIKAGDKIISVTVSFTNIVYEDALTILSYASPYDVQLELERIPDKSRVIPASPSTSKRLGSCSFNNSGQKLFHPLYRSQSIDDLTQIDKDTLPSHGIGPRRSQSVGVAAHKLAAHFKNSDSKLEESTERSPASIILSTTGSLNEKMLANVMADGALHKNGLQWEKRFEDTLEGDPPSKASKLKTEKKPTSLKAFIASKQSNSSFDGETSDSSIGHAKKSHNFIKKNQDFRDYPHKGKLQEFHPTSGSSSSRGEDASKITAQVHQSSKANSRTKTLTEASHALWHLDQSIKDCDTSLDDMESSGNCAWEKSGKVGDEDELPSKKSAMKSSSKRNASEKRDTGNDSDVSGDSLEYTSKKHESRKTKQKEAYKKHQKQQFNDKNVTLEHSHESSNLNNSHSLQQHITKKTDKNQMDQNLFKEQLDERPKNNVSQLSNQEFVHNIMEKRKSHQKLTNNHHTYDQERDHVSRIMDKDYIEYPNNKPTLYGSEREMQEKNENDYYCMPIKSNGRSLYSETNLENTLSESKSSINGENEAYGSKYVSNSKCGYPQKNPPLSFQRQMSKASESDTKAVDSKNKAKSNYKEVKQSTKPAGTFTQINPFQQPTRPKNAIFKPWNKKDDKNSDLSINGNDVHYFSMPNNNSHITTSDSSEQRMRRDNSSELLSYTSRSGEEISKTVLITSYDSNNRSLSNTHINSQNSHLRQMHK